MPKLTASGKQSQAWKDAEREVREVFSRFGFTAERVIREDHGASDWDVRIKELPFLVVDSKYKAAGFAHHTLFEQDLLKRYCGKDKTRKAIMPTKSGKQKGMFVTLELDYLVELMALAYLKRRKKKNEWSCNNCGSACEVLPNHAGSLHRYSCPACQLVVYSEYKPSA